jgi:hypothetical protein
VRVLVDYHHHDLWESLELLFTDRFGWELLRPIGMDWFEQGYWNHERKWHGDAIARQYLTPWGSDISDLDGRLTRLDTSHNRVQRLVTLEMARDLRPDIVISSLAHNHEGLRPLRRRGRRDVRPPARQRPLRRTSTWPRTAGTSPPSGWCRASCP